MNEKLEKRLVSRLDKLHARVGNDLKANQRSTIKEIEKSLGDISKLLVSESKEGKISVSSTNKIKRKLNEIERGIRASYEESIEESIEDYALRAYDALDSTFPDEGISEDTFVSSVINSIMNTKQEDGLNLIDRFRRNASVIRQALETVIIYGILSRKDIKDIMKNVDEEFDRLHWTINRVVISETYNAYRMSVMRTLKALGDDYVILFEEGTCGRPDHHTHDCYTLARTDRHGLGDGVFTADDTDIVFPHPSCTSSLTIKRKGELDA